MSETDEVKQKNNDEEFLDKLGNFICDTRLEELEKHYEKFNIFDCIGMNTQEIKHSNFLAWLFSPKENQGIGDFFIKEFLKNVLKGNKNSWEKNNSEIPIPTIFDIDCWDMSEIEVKRECKNIDILILDDINSFLCVIENKIKSKEHSSQCKRYYKLIEGEGESANDTSNQKESDDNAEFKKYKEKYKYRLYLYLKPENNEKIENYIYASYEAISATIDKVKNKERVSPNLLIVLEHYQELLQRDILKNGDIKKLCLDIYEINREAINIIKNICCNNKDLQIAFKECLKKCIINDKDLELIGDNRQWITFTHKELSDFKGFFWYAFNNDTSTNSCIDLRIQFDTNIDKHIIEKIYNIYEGHKDSKKNKDYIRIKKILETNKYNELSTEFSENGNFNFKLEKEIKEYLKLNNEETINQIKKILKNYGTLKIHKTRNQQSNTKEYSEEIEKRCKNIYSNHKCAINEIVKNINKTNK